jgi:histidinol-phosphatase (PHP family)
MSRILYETHMHTPLCKHAEGMPDDYAAVAWRRGLAGITVTCHNPMPDGFSPHVRMSVGEFGQYLDMVAQARDAWRGRIDVRLGLECDYFPGYESWLDQQLRSAEFDYVLGSVHPQLREWQEYERPESPVAYQRAYFQRLADSAETGLFDCLAHPDLVKNVTAPHWRVDDVIDDIRRALDRIAATGVAMELNTSGLNKTIPQMNPGPRILREMFERGIPVNIGADAHVPDRVADDFEQAIGHLRDAGYERVGYSIGRQRREVSLEDALMGLHPAAEAALRADRYAGQR